MEAKRGVLFAMKGEKVKNMYKLIRKIVASRAMKVEPSQERSLFVVKKVARGKQCNEVKVTNEDKA